MLASLSGLSQEKHFKLGNQEPVASRCVNAEHKLIAKFGLKKLQTRNLVCRCEAAPGKNKPRDTVHLVATLSRGKDYLLA